MIPSYSCANNWRSTPKSPSGDVFSVEILDDREQQVIVRFTGENAARIFSKESGGHRWQRVPPTERGGRVHSSTVTVAVMREVAPEEYVLRDCDLEIKTCRGSGPGGQNVNKVESAVQVKHLPTGVLVRCQTERSQKQNKAFAIQLLRSRLVQARDDKAFREQAQDRRAQVGSGERSDKIRTVQVKNNIVVNHLTGKKMRLKDYLRGEIEKVA